MDYNSIPVDNAIRGFLETLDKFGFNRPENVNLVDLFSSGQTVTVNRKGYDLTDYDRNNKEYYPPAGALYQDLHTDAVNVCDLLREYLQLIEHCYLMLTKLRKMRKSKQRKFVKMVRKEVWWDIVHGALIGQVDPSYDIMKGVDLFDNWSRMDNVVRERMVRHTKTFADTLTKFLNPTGASFVDSCLF